MTFPQRPVRYIVPYAAGGPTDAVARLLAPRLAERWSQPVQVENRPGANANIGAEMVAQAPADGHVLLQGTSSTHGSNPVLYARLPYDAHRDFVPVVALIEGPVYLCVRAEAEWTDVAAFLAAARDRGTPLLFGTTGPGSPQHLAGELLGVKAGLPVQATHLRGAEPAFEALARGEIDLYFDSTGPRQERAGRARVLAVSTRWRWPLASEFPTLVESGIADFEIHGWFGLFAPRGTPTDVIRRINADVDALLGDTGLREAIEDMGLRPLGGPPQDLLLRVRRESAYWAEVVRASRIGLL